MRTICYTKVDDRLYRGPQPSETDLRLLKDIGVKAIVNLRADPSFEEQLEAERLGMLYISAPLSTEPAPTQDRIGNILDDIEALDVPTYVHCEAGQLRTGVVVGCYRVKHGWQPDKALNEALDMGLPRTSWTLWARRLILEFKP